MKKKSYRPTKNASKRRRDLLNTCITEIQDLLPVMESQKKQLSHLQVMSLCNAYVALKKFMDQGKKIEPPTPAAEICSNLNLLQCLSGFILVATGSGKLLYISDNVSDYLGYSAVDLLTFGDSIYDIIESSDQAYLQQVLEIKGKLLDSVSESHFQLQCHMSISRSLRQQSKYKRFKMVDMKGHFFPQDLTQRDLNQDDPIFIAFCSCQQSQQIVPPESLTFLTFHELDMKYSHIDHNANVHLGYERLTSKSWYDIVHPDDLEKARNAHVEVLKQSNKFPDKIVSATVRLLTSYGGFIWLNISFRIFGKDKIQKIICVNRVLTDGQHCADLNAISIREQYGSQFSAEANGEFYLTSDSEKSLKCWINNLSLSATLKRPYSGCETRDVPAAKVPNLGSSVSDKSLKIYHPILAEMLECPPLLNKLNTNYIQNGNLSPSLPLILSPTTMLQRLPSPADQRQSNYSNFSETESLSSSVSTSFYSEEECSFESLLGEYSDSTMLNQKSLNLLKELNVAETFVPLLDNNISVGNGDFCCDALSNLELPDLETVESFLSDSEKAVLAKYCEEDMVKIHQKPAITGNLMQSLSERLKEVEKLHQAMVYATVVDIFSNVTNSCGMPDEKSGDFSLSGLLNRVQMQEMIM